MRRDLKPEAEVARVQAEYEEHKQTESYKTWLKNITEKSDTHYIRGDKDPEGFEEYLALHSTDGQKGPIKRYLDFAIEVAAKNPESAELQVKCLSFFIVYEKQAEALKAGKVLCERHVGYHKTARAIAKLEKYLAGKSDELNTQLKTFKEERAKVEADPGFNDSLEFASEQLKLNGDAKLAVKALDTDMKAHVKVYLAERVHKRLIKLKKDSEAQSFKEKAQKLYLWSPYFEGKHMADK